MSSAGVIILSAPSGAGKTSLARELVARRGDVGLAVSHTTRGRRRGETDGVDYHFVTQPQFEEMINAGRFVEYAAVFGNHYGTSHAAIDTLVAAGRHALLEIDWQGARTVRRKFPAARSVFVMPPSVDALEARLRARRRDDDDTIAERMRAARDEMSHRDEYDHIIINDQFEPAVAKLMALV